MSVKLSIAKVPEGVTISWTGGIDPFLLQKADTMDTMSPIWTNVKRPTITRSITLPASGQAGYFRVEEGVKMLDIDTTKPDTLLVWQIPDLF